TSPRLPRGRLPSCTRRRLWHRIESQRPVAPVEVAQPAHLGQRPWRTNESLPERPCLCQCPPPATLLAAVAPPPDLGLPPCGYRWQPAPDRQAHLSPVHTCRPNRVGLGPLLAQQPWSPKAMPGSSQQGRRVRRDTCGQVRTVP